MFFINLYITKENEELRNKKEREGIDRERESEKRISVCFTRGHENLL